MKTSHSLAFAYVALFSSLSVVDCLEAGDADLMWNAYNHVFLKQQGNATYYQGKINDTTPDPMWSGSYDMFIAEDVYYRKGDVATQALVSDLCNTWLRNNPPGWHWDGWNDDLAWYTLALIRGYQATGNLSLLEPAMNGSDYVFARGWNTESNDGGIWEQNPEYLPAGETSDKQALSNSGNAKVACMIYQSTHEQEYLDRCQTIYSWIRTHIFNTTTGQINNGISTDGQVTPSKEAYNQGTFLGLAHLLWLITGDTQYFDDAKLALDFGMNNVTVNGIFSNNASYLNGWADEFARGAGNFVHDNNLWEEYYAFFVSNANAILTNRRPDLNVTWNGWNQPTPLDDGLITNKFIGAVSWLQYTPVSQPPDLIMGIRTISNKQTNLVINSAGTWGSWGNGQRVELQSNQGGQNQRWLLSMSEDYSWSIVNLDTWLALGAAGASSNDSSITYSQSLRTDGQRWYIDSEGTDAWRITNKLTGLVLDGDAGSSANGSLMLSQWNNSTSQQWALQGLQH